MKTAQDEQREIMEEKFDETGDVDALNWLIKDACESEDE